VVADIERFLSVMQENPYNLHTLNDVIRYPEDTPEEELEKWNINTLKSAAGTGGVTDHDASRFATSETLCLHIDMEVARLLDKHECNILVAPMWTEATWEETPQIAVPMPAHPTDWPLPVRRKYD
jgi:hypothetical protein